LGWKKPKTGPGRSGGWGRGSPGDGSSPEHPLGMDPAPISPFLGGPSLPPRPSRAVPGGRTDGHGSSRPLRPDPGQGMSNFIPSLGPATPTPRKRLPLPAHPRPPGSWEGMAGESGGTPRGHPRGTAWG